MDELYNLLEINYPRFPEIWDEITKLGYLEPISKLHSKVPYVVRKYVDLPVYERMAFIQLVLGISYEDFLTMIDNGHSIESALQSGMNTTWAIHLSNMMDWRLLEQDEMGNLIYEK